MDIDMEGDSVLTRMLQAVAVPFIGNVCYVFMHGLNRVQIYGAEKPHQALQHRPSNKPLITVSNHLRWTLCASDRCFRNPVTSAFFKHVKVLPLAHGEGIYQKFVVSLLFVAAVFWRSVAVAASRMPEESDFNVLMIIVVLILMSFGLLLIRVGFWILARLVLFYFTIEIVM